MSKTKNVTASTATTESTASTVAAPKAAKTPKVPAAPKEVKAPAAPKAAKAPKTDAAAVVAAVSAEVAAPKAKAAKTPKVPAVAAAQTDAAAVAAPVVVSTETVSSESGPTVNGDFSEFMTKLQQVSSLISSLKSEFRTLEKKASRELKTANKASAKRKRKTGNRSPSGFVKPTLISNELAGFLGKEHGSEMARTEVTREINAYIRANSLQDKANGRQINADKKLKTLLKINDGDVLTYFNLQRYMSPHFAKASAAAVTVS
jgi:chromatin remodeling complex protein RSC6